jgi:ribosomal protein L37AE/L43A
MPDSIANFINELQQSKRGWTIVDEYFTQELKSSSSVDRIVTSNDKHSIQSMSNTSIPCLDAHNLPETDRSMRRCLDAHNLPETDRSMRRCLDAHSLSETDRSMRRCPRCQSGAIRRIGLTSSGTQRYKCNNCSKSFTGTQVGRPCLGDRPLTNYESVKKSRQKSKLNSSKLNSIDPPSPPD